MSSIQEVQKLTFQEWNVPENSGNSHSSDSWQSCHSEDVLVISKVNYSELETISSIQRLDQVQISTI